MARYALVDNNEQIVFEKDETRINFDAGLQVDHSWRQIVNEVNDLSTPGNFDTKSSSQQFVEPTQVRRVRTIVDLSAGEVDDIRDAVVDSFDAASRDHLFAVAKMERKILGTLYKLAEQINPGLTKAQFAAQLETNKDEISQAQFKQALKNELP